MRSFALVAAAAGLVAAGDSWGPKGGDSWGSKSAESWAPMGTGAPVYVTDVVTAYTTYCPSATQLTHNGVTYTVTEATTLTISNCPCTVTRPVESAKPTSSGPAVVTPVPSQPASVAPVPSKPASSYFPSVAAPSSVAGTATSAPAATYTGAASKAQVAGAGLLAVLGAAAVAL